MGIVEQITRLNEAKKYEELCRLLDRANEDKAAEIKEILPNLLEHHSVIVRTSALDYVGYCKSEEYITYVVNNLCHNNSIVKSYALSVYYELLKEKAIPILTRESGSSVVKIKLKALTLLYIEKQEETILKSIEKIVTRKNCKQSYQFSVYYTFDYFLETNNYPNILNLYRKIVECSSNVEIVNMLKEALKKTLTPSSYREP